jgi:hypothetical protein
MTSAKERDAFGPVGLRFAKGRIKMLICDDGISTNYAAETTATPHSLPDVSGYVPRKSKSILGHNL